MMILVFAPGLAKWIMVKGLKLIEHFRFLKPKTTRLEKLEASMDQYHETAAFWASHKLVILKVFLITMVQRILYLQLHTGYTVRWDFMDIPL